MVLGSCFSWSQPPNWQKLVELYSQVCEKLKWRRKLPIFYCTPYSNWLLEIHLTRWQWNCGLASPGCLSHPLPIKAVKSRVEEKVLKKWQCTKRHHTLQQDLLEGLNFSIEAFWSRMPHGSWHMGPLCPHISCHLSSCSIMAKCKTIYSIYKI